MYMNNTLYIDPDYAIQHLWFKINFTPLGYGEIPNEDMRMLAIIEYDETEITVEVLNKFYTNFSMFCFTESTPQNAVELCNKWYPAPEGEDNYFSLDTDGFTIIDNRPKDLN